MIVARMNIFKGFISLNFEYPQAIATAPTTKSGSSQDNPTPIPDNFNRSHITARIRPVKKIRLSTLNFAIRLTLYGGKSDCVSHQLEVPSMKVSYENF